MKYFIFPVLVFASLASNAQVCIKGVALESSKTALAGDTLTLCGAYENPDEKKLYYYFQESDKMIPASSIRLLLDEVNFWDLQQFYYTSYTISKKGWQLEKRKELEQQTLNYIARMESEKKILQDKYAEDYLQRIIQRIHYPKIWKGRDQFLTVKILNSDQKVCYAFDNGTLLISSQLIAETTNERELFKIMTEAVAHVLLDSNLDNLQSNSNSELAQLGAIYSSYDKKRIQIIAERFMDQYEHSAEFVPFSNNELIHSTAGIIAYTAWQEYYSQHYQKSLDYISLLEEYQIANSTDYLLKAKIFMKIADTPEANQEIVKYLKKAASFSDQELPEIYSELGVALTRENNYEEARHYFLKYYDLVLKMADQEKMEWALKMINLCNAHLKTTVAPEPENNQDE